MPNKIVFTVSAKEPTLPDCVKFVEKSYVDTVTKNKDYFGESQISIAFINYCNVAFKVPQFTVFENTENGGDFKAVVDAFSIGANQQINIPIRYYGVIQTDSDFKTFILAFNGSSAFFTLNIVSEKTNTAPVIQSVDILLENRTNKVFSLADFDSKYSDIDGDALDSIVLEGDLSQFRLNGNKIISPYEITVYQLNIGALIYLAKDTDEEVVFTATLKAKDSRGLISN